MSTTTTTRTPHVLVVEQIARVLAEHIYDMDSGSCSCDWAVDYENEDASEVMQVHQHQAEQIAALDGATSTALAEALQGLVDVVTEIDTRRLIPECHAFTGDDGYCRVCTAMQNAEGALSQVTEWQPADTDTDTSTITTPTIPRSTR